ncbi:hypothetical protein MTO96_040618 [Rhipicephalus appendiculatus]
MRGRASQGRTAAEQVRGNSCWGGNGLRAAAWVDQCLKLWKKLRDRFNRERKLIEQSKRSGAGYIAKRSWEFLSAMEFYKDCGRMRPTVSNVCSSQEVASQDITVEELVSGMCGTGTVSPLSPADDVEEEIGQPDQRCNGQAALQIDEPTAVKPSISQKKRKKNSEF